MEPPLSIGGKMADTFHFHQWKIGIDGGYFCRICHKTREQLLNERIEVLEQQAQELTTCIKLIDTRFEAFVNLVLAYSNGASQDLTTFKQALEGVNNDEETEHDEEEH
jgi:hypothetical protein